MPYRSWQQRPSAAALNQIGKWVPTNPAIHMLHGVFETKQGIFYNEQLTDWMVNPYRSKRSKPSKQTNMGAPWKKKPEPFTASA
jgi:hypothetical protein